MKLLMILTCKILGHHKPDSRVTRMYSMHDRTWKSQCPRCGAIITGVW